MSVDLGTSSRAFFVNGHDPCFIPEGWPLSRYLKKILARGAVKMRCTSFKDVGLILSGQGFLRVNF